MKTKKSIPQRILTYAKDNPIVVMMLAAAIVMCFVDRNF